jgi:hypothetical protein
MDEPDFYVYSCKLTELYDYLENKETVVPKLYVKVVPGL